MCTWRDTRAPRAGFSGGWNTSYGGGVFDGFVASLSAQVRTCGQRTWAERALTFCCAVAVDFERELLRDGTHEQPGLGKRRLANDLWLAAPMTASS